MSSSKLSDAEKQEIVKLYQQMPEETTITLADRYGVSSSTVRRVLQSAIPKDTYETLTQQKQRLHRTGKRSTRYAEEPEESPLTSTIEQESQEQFEEQFEEVSPGSDSSPTIKRRRKRSSAIENEIQSLDSEASSPSIPKPIIKSGNEQSNSSPKPNTATNIELIAEDFLQEEFSEFEQEDDDDNDDDDYIEEDSDDGEEREKFFSSSFSMGGSSQVKILPLTEAELPKTCYLVIDRAAELVAKPLKAFSELGQIPADEVHEKTLPVFDNHRVASRFSARNQRVFKVPDTRLLQKAAPCLQAKGITLLLIDGQVYRF